MWALGISAIEMAEGFPPRWKVNPNRVIFMVVRDPPPWLADKERWSLVCQDFVAQCLQKVSGCHCCVSGHGQSHWYDLKAVVSQQGGGPVPAEGKGLCW